jgi:aminomethyltransferase
MTSQARNTPLFALHAALGARMIEFAGYNMPVSYSGIIEEHLAVRHRAGVFDLSHMGEFELRGAGATELLERALTNSVRRLAADQAQYTLMCDADGGVIDDLIVYRVEPDCYLLCVNASNIEADREWLAQLNRAGVQFHDRSEETGLVAIQGPRAQAIVARLTSIDLPGLRRFRSTLGEVAGLQCRIARTGYTGEDGFELFIAAAQAQRLFEALLEAGASEGIKPCGLGARDTLRMEAALPLYGHELDRATSPLDAGLGMYVRFGRGFIGEQALSVQRNSPPRKRLVGIRTSDGRSIARPGYPLRLGEREVGIVTSGTFAPSFNRPLAMAYLMAGRGIDLDAPAGTHIEVEIRHKAVAAELVALPFYRRPASNQ